MKKIVILLVSFISASILSQQQGNVGVNTTTPQKTLHVNGSLQVTNELNVGGDDKTAGNAGNAGQVLTSQGSNKAPAWNSLRNDIAGVLSKTLYFQGTQSKIITEGSTSDVPGLSFSITVPSTVTSQTLVMTLIGYIARPINASSGNSQGVFSIIQDGVKITSAYTSITAAGGGSPNLINLPIPCTIMKTINLTPGTYNFTVNFTSWVGTVRVNPDPSNYKGYDNDNEAMLSKMSILVFNN